MIKQQRMRLLKTVVFICLTSSYGESYRTASRVRGSKAPMFRRRRLVTEIIVPVDTNKPDVEMMTGNGSENNNSPEMLPLPENMPDSAAEDTETIQARAKQEVASGSETSSVRQANEPELLSRDDKPTAKSENKGKLGKKQHMATRSMYKHAGKNNIVVSIEPPQIKPPKLI